MKGGIPPFQNPRPSRRQILKLAASVAALPLFPAGIQRALALPARQVTGTVQDIGHIVILMQENRSFDHYFGTLRGVRGFGDRHPVPLASGKPVWFQSDGTREIPPYRINTAKNGLLTPGTPHQYDNAQGAWGQGKLDHWPQFKTPNSMGHYLREDIPFQFALAEAFTLCDAYHCSLTTGTDPNRIVFWSGSNFDPGKRRQGVNCTGDDAEVNNLRCLVSGKLPDPGYAYQGSSFTWPTLPELLEKAGISWRIYQDPNDNWHGLMHGALAFKNFRESRPGSPLYDKGMTHHTLERFKDDVESGNLPQVSWILPTMQTSEHPSGSSSIQGAELTSRVIDALTSNPGIWGQSVLFLSFDENDGLFDHVPPPAPPSYNLDGTPAGKSTVDLAGEYFSDPEHKYLHQDDKVSGNVRPYGMGPRVPMYVISPWSRGGWVDSQVFDHTSIGRFLEKRFGITVPAISPWHRAVSGDLLSAFDFKTPNDAPFPDIPFVHDSAARLAATAKLPKPAPPQTPEPLFQEAGMRRSRALPYEIHAAALLTERGITVEFHNTGQVGAVFHAYDKLHLDRIPRRYTVEAGKKLDDSWNADDGRYNLWIYGPGGFVREFSGAVGPDKPRLQLKYDRANSTIELLASQHGKSFTIRPNAYRTDAPTPLQAKQRWSLSGSHGWYDFTVSGQNFEHRFAGRMETGAPSFSDPAV